MILVLGVGLPFSKIYPGYYLKKEFSTPSPGASFSPRTARELISGMPQGFVGGPDVKADIQFDISGEGGGKMVLFIAGGRCTFREGVGLPIPDQGKTTTLEQEMELIRAYMNIYRVRMGDRLRCRIEIPEHLTDRPFPPMLVQPLVENAIKHGLEPKVDGGEISIVVQENEDILRLAVSDTGMGFDEKAAAGIGLSNIRERLQTLFNGRARLILEENFPSGLKAILEVPNEKNQSPHRGR